MQLTEYMLVLILRLMRAHGASMQHSAESVPAPGLSLVGPCGLLNVRLNNDVSSYVEMFI